jgi:SAM-dependent methyltransferase
VRTERHKQELNARWRGGHVATTVYQDIVLERAFHGCRVLHAGCGWDRSKIAGTLRDKADAFVFGIDLDFEAVKRNKNSSAVANLENVPAPDSAFDIVIMEYVIEHLENPGRVFAELGRTLAAGGVIIFLTPSAFSYKALVARLTPQRFHEFVGRRRYGFGAEQDMYPTVYRANSKRSLQRALHAAGLELEAIVAKSNGPTWFVGTPVAFGVAAWYHKLIERIDLLAPLRCAIVGVAHKRA